MKKCKNCGAKLKGMAKCMKCSKKSMHKSTKASLPESDLLKALDDLESVAKGAIPKEMKDADGGFATEGDGDELQVSADENAEPKKVSKSVKKAKKSEEESAEESSMDKGEDEESSMDKADDEESSDEEHSPAETSSPELSDDDVGENFERAKKAKKSTKKSVSKSIKKSLMEDETNSEMVNASSFLESLIDQVSDSNVEMAKSLRHVKKSFDRQEERSQTQFGQLAKAMTLLGNITVGIAKSVRGVVESLENIPDMAQGRTKLSKSDVEQRHFQDTGDSASLDPSMYNQYMDRMIELAQKGQMPSEFVSEFELTKSLEGIPESYRSLITSGLH